MPGVNVKLEGTSNETLTDAEGKFKLDLQYNDSLQVIVFSFKGFRPYTYIYNTTGPGREVAVDMIRYDVENVQHLLATRMGGIQTTGCHVPREIARDVWLWLTGR